MQTNILLKVCWKVSRCWIAEMKAKVILLTWVNIPVWVNVILVKMDSQDSYFPMKRGHKENQGNTKEIWLWFTCDFHNIRWNVFLAMFCYCLFSKRHISFLVLQLKEGRWHLHGEAKTTECEEVHTHIQKEMKSSGNLISSKMIKGLENKAFKKDQRGWMSREANAERHCNGLKCWVPRVWWATPGNSTSNNFLCDMVANTALN